MSDTYSYKQGIKTFCSLFTLALLVSCAPRYIDSTPREQTPAFVSTESSQVAIGFSPYGSALELIMKGIGQAKQTIRVASYSFTSKPISNALVQASKRGVDVRVIADEKANASKYSAIRYIANKGIPTKTNNHYQIFHHKFIVIDDKHTETGSFNYTAAAAAKNAENALMIWNNKKVARIYTDEWNKLWKESDTVIPDN